MAEPKVEDVMTHLVVTLYPEDTLHEAAVRLARNDISGAPVVSEGKVVGIITEADILRALAKPAPVEQRLSPLDILLFFRRLPDLKPDGIRVREAMTREVVTVGPQTSVWKAAEIMQRKRLKRLPVVDEEGRLVGIVSRGDLVRFIGRHDHQIREDVLKRISVLGEDTLSDLKIEVRDGVVLLWGKVDRASTHRLAVKLASRTPGVVEVRDRLEHEWDDSKSLAPDGSISPWNEIRQI